MARKKLSREAFFLQIDDLSHDGRGVARREGKVVFVTGALPNEKIMAQLTKAKRSYAEANMLEVLEPSTERIEPKCAYFLLCGGCVMQHLSMEKQIEYKQQHLLNALKKSAKISPKEILPAIDELHFGYRRKARLGVKVVDKKGGALVGFRELGSGFVAVMDSCEVLHPHIGKRILAIKDLINAMPNGHKIAQIEVAMGDEACILIFRHLVDLTLLDIDLLNEFGKQYNFYIYTQSGGVNTVIPLNTHHQTCLRYQVDGVVFEFGPSHFTQVNSEINQKMVAKAIDLLALKSEDRVLDLFCGLGNFTLPIAKQCTFVKGIEVSKNLVDDAIHNANLNQIDNVEFAQLDLQSESFFGTWLKETWDKVLLDPPRSGAIEIIPIVAKIAPEIVVYVSCNPATFVRDSDVLVNKFGYELERIGVMNMFPHTAHVESIAQFRRKLK